VPSFIFVSTCIYKYVIWAVKQHRTRWLELDLDTVSISVCFNLSYLMTVTFDLLTPKPNQSIFVPKHTSNVQFEENLSINIRINKPPKWYFLCIWSCCECWPLTPKHSQFTFVPRCTTDKSSVKIHRCTPEILQKHYGQTHTPMHPRTYNIKT